MRLDQTDEGEVETTLRLDQNHENEVETTSRLDQIDENEGKARRGGFGKPGCCLRGSNGLGGGGRQGQCWSSSVSIAARAVDLWMGWIDAAQLHVHPSTQTQGFLALYTFLHSRRSILINGMTAAIVDLAMMVALAF